MEEIWEQLVTDIKKTPLVEYIAVITGIASVWFSRKENILVYPVGLISTSLFIYIYIKYGLYAEAGVNLYYTVMSVIGWKMWSRSKQGIPSLKISQSGKAEWIIALVFFGICFLLLFLWLKYLPLFLLKMFEYELPPSTVPLADSFTAAAAFTAMWLMTKKKIENWIWWIITNIASIPLNFQKHLVFTSFQFVVFLVLAIMGYISWKKKLQSNHA